MLVAVSVEGTFTMYITYGPVFLTYNYALDSTAAEGRIEAI